MTIQYGTGVFLNFRKRRDMKMTDDQEKLLEDALGTVKVLFSLVLKTKNPYPGFLSEVWIQTHLLVFYDKIFEFLVLKMIFFIINICQIFLFGLFERPPRQNIQLFRA
jgi:hypothetical protein